MHPAITLLGTTQYLLAFLIPFLLGLLTYRTEKRARLWFAAGVLYAVYLILLFVFPGKDFSAIRVLQIAMLWHYIAVLLYFLLRETETRVSPWWIPLAAALPSVIAIYLSFTGARFAEQVTLSLFVVAGDSAIGLLALLLGIQGKGKGFFLVSASGFLVASVNLMRAGELLLGSGNFAFTDFTWKTNLLIVGHLVGIIFVNIGYAGVVIERAAQREAAARESQRVTEEMNRKIAALLDERDHMVMINSQFATMSGMSVLTGAIVHEITQPIQALVMAIDKAKSEAGGFPELSDSFRSLEEQAADCISIVQSLRLIMSRGRTEAELADLSTITRDVIPIIKSECDRRKIAFDADVSSDALTCRVNPVLFKRIIINLASNAIDALAETGPRQARLSIALGESKGRAILEVADNSGQKTEIETLSFETLVASRKPTGMGLGLMLCAKIANAWGGKLTVKGDQPSDLSVFMLELPLGDGSA